MHCYNCECELEENVGIYSDITGKLYCESCYYSEFGRCDNCCCECYDSELYHTENGNRLCESCYKEYEETSIIQGYHNRDLPLEFLYLEEELKDGMTKDDLLYFGFELEVYNTKQIISKQEMAKMIRKTYPNLKLVFEEDSSLGSSSGDARRNGFEIISEPMTKKIY